MATAEQVLHRRLQGELSTSALRCVAVDEADLVLCRQADSQGPWLEEVLSEHTLPQVERLGLPLFRCTTCQQLVGGAT